MRKLQQASSDYGGSMSGLSNSMVGGGLVVPATATSGHSFGKASYDVVYSVIRGCREWIGRSWWRGQEGRVAKLNWTWLLTSFPAKATFIAQLMRTISRQQTISWMDIMLIPYI